ncbi:ABC transporter ATP-binding protein [Parvibaculum sp.]|uniref:ABC transporter ATP-binding protein n=1 Tax=Parvibaculum sp. TaxID=2024848 RepID=UPI0025F3037B|nr:ABC transporter ATP-binding protein [Parvibaculum sp.]
MASGKQPSAGAAAEPMIVIDGLTKHFGPFTAVDGIGFSVAKGEVLGFLGPNGAGKSTTMKMVTGFLAPSAGTARVCGHDIVTSTLEAQRVIGYLPEGAPAYGDMTVRGFLKFIARVRRLAGADAEKAIGSAVEATELEGVLEQPIDTLSKGFRRRVGLAQAILHNPPVLIMDEPTDGLDPNQKFEVRKLIKRMAAEKAIVISTHILEEVDAICTRALIIDRGRIVADGTPAELMARSRYHNAVSLTLGGRTTVEMAAKLRAIAGIESIEVSPRGDETTFTLFPVRTGEGDTVLIDAVARLAREENWQVRALYGEAGRLDEVFRRLTRSDTNGSGKEAA